MAKKTDKRSTTSARRERVCRVAYTLNNDQPVRSTIIGDQPLFYMDYTHEDEDSDLSLLEDGIDALREKITPHRYGLSDANPTETRMQEFLDEVSCVCAREGRGQTAGIEDVLSAARASRYLLSMMDSAQESGVTIKYCPQVEYACYDRDLKCIQINPRLGTEEQILLLARELRRAWQHRSGVLVNPLTFFPDQAILVNRAQIADLSVSMVRAAWELQLSGNRGPWERLEVSPMGDLVRTFAREAFLDFRTLNNGIAMAATFEAWFLSERCRRQDKVLIQNMLADYQGYVFGSEQASRAVTADLITALGAMPFGKNYLASYATMILADPVFNEVRDRSNANFLWFIKFEKSFREAEQELQLEAGTPRQGVAPGIPATPHKDFTHEKTATVIALNDHFPDPASAAPRGRNAGGAGTNGQIVRFPRPGRES